MLCPHDLAHKYFQDLCLWISPLCYKFILKLFNVSVFHQVCLCSSASVPLSLTFLAIILSRCPHSFICLCLCIQSASISLTILRYCLLLFSCHIPSSFSLGSSLWFSPWVFFVGRFLLTWQSIFLFLYFIYLSKVYFWTCSYQSTFDNLLNWDKSG